MTNVISDEIVRDLPEGLFTSNDGLAGLCWDGALALAPEEKSDLGPVARPHNQVDFPDTVPRQQS